MHSKDRLPSQFSLSVFSKEQTASSVEVGDLVEVVDKSAFLKAINWEMLKASRNPDNVFEVYL